MEVAARPAASALKATGMAMQAGLPTRLGAFGVWGSGTGVGKTLVSAGLLAAARRRGTPSLYLKPVQTGFPADSDGRLVAALSGGCAHALGAHAAAAADRALGHLDADALAPCRTLFAWRAPVSPHLAVEREGRAVDDAAVMAATRGALAAFAQGIAGDAFALVETAGGPASPGPSGALQADLLRPLRLPCVLVGDGGLGGISASLCAHDALLLRGLDTPLLALLDGGLANEAAIARHTARAGTRVFALPRLAKPAGGADASVEAVAAWLEACAPHFDEMHGVLLRWQAARLAALAAAPAEASRRFWWPFTQHSLAGPVTLIDSRYGDEFTVVAQQARAEAAVGRGAGLAGTGAGTGVETEAVLECAFDACASWWTQGVGAKGQPEITRAIAYAAARWGHVMFPEASHDAALSLARRLLEGSGAPGRGWASRVFFSDDGSTAMEIAFKMAFRKFYADKGLLAPPTAPALGLAAAAQPPLPRVLVVALHGSYHGDTLGAMDAQPPSVFAGPLQSPWYEPRGLFLETPSLALRDGVWSVQLPAELADALAAEQRRQHAQQRLPQEHGRASDGSAAGPRGGERGGACRAAAGAACACVDGGAAAASPGAAACGGCWAERADALAVDPRLATPLAAVYRRSIAAALDGAACGPALPAALVLEPVLQGAGGMVLVDPLFQRLLCEEARSRQLPLIFDEVFVGLYRLGMPSTAALLGVAPDIACYAKLLTGGTVPLAVTLASEAVFAAFSGATKPQALLHGHSYSAHAIGCAAACAALDAYADPTRNPNILPASGTLRELWPAALVRELSTLPSVERVVCLGTVFAAAIRTSSGGYASEATATLVRRLVARGVRARPLGNVLYLMVAPTTEPAVCEALLLALRDELDAAPVALGCDGSKMLDNIP